MLAIFGMSAIVPARPASVSSRHLRDLKSKPCAGEPPQVLRRLRHSRRWSDDNEGREVFARGSGAIAPSTYDAHTASKADPELRSQRAKTGEALIPEVQRVWSENHEAYGVRKVWRQTRRERFGVAR